MEKVFKVTQAKGVESGIHKARENNPAFAIIVLRVRDGNGPEVVKKI